MATPKNSEHGSSDLSVVYRDPRSLKTYDRNARIHSKKQIAAIAKSIEAFGFTNPALIDRNGRIVAGHGRVRAAALLGISHIPTIVLEGLTEAQLRTYMLADNRLAEMAKWDKELVALELEYINELDLALDLTLSGFETPEIDLLLDGPATKSSDPAADKLPAMDFKTAPVTQPGDIWILGDHRLLCGDATLSASVEKLMGGYKAAMTFIDPPYNVPIDGHVCGLGAVRHREFAMASGEMSEAEFIEFLTKSFRVLANYSKDGSIHFACIDWRHLYEALAAGRTTFDDVLNLCVWTKSNGGMGSFYRSQHELVIVFKSGKNPHINNIELGKHGRYRTNVWSYPGANTFRVGRDEELAMHPTVKPVALVADAIKDCSHRGDIVLDTFAGSGTTLIACEKTGRRGFAMELDPIYVDGAIRRWEDYSGGIATLEATGTTFEETAHVRTAVDHLEILETPETDIEENLHGE